jgi:16S rRNA processing protein RimM
LKQTDLIAIARVKAPSGLKGKMWITPFGEGLTEYEYLIIGSNVKPIKLLSVEKRKHGFIIALEGITDISQVEQIKGEILSIKRRWLPEVEEGEYYWADLIGLTVVDLAGRVLGEIVNIFRTGANDVYVVDKVKQYYIPAIKNVVKEVSIERGEMVIDSAPLEGLLD